MIAQSWKGQSNDLINSSTFWSNFMLIYSILITNPVLCYTSLDECIQSYWPSIHLMFDLNFVFFFFVCRASFSSVQLMSYISKNEKQKKKRFHFIR